ncbi:hypothetical protein B0I35DRAFT_495191, partial [Stachybotrys elegans]
CGYDPDDHCKEGMCSSNCNATAECGRFADPPGLECPIFVCCSKHGFCGVEADYCGDGCQSNCKEPVKTNPHTTDVRELVIGYVEGWAFTREGCAKRTLHSIRVDSVTHLYVSFGYIQPGSFRVHLMGDVMGEDVLAITNLKRKAPGLKVFIALGGWTFNDPGSTESVFGDLARTQETRARFLNNLEDFMIHYGFDGVDYDWEYPGADDRGGREGDGDNYVSLVEDTRNKFKNNARGWGISFTAPSSYWYLRHFNIKDMMPHVDYVNLMTYDLYGSWDGHSDWIGPHVYAHTNLTVIKRALNLLWRNDVPANQVNLGLGFYGRTYQLADSSCDTPGCEFKDPGKAGTCSGQGGYMSYQDIAEVRKSNPPVVTDRENAIKYFRYDDDQWVSYDDEETLKWKVEFANSKGLRGLFIWAITQDTDKNELLDAVLQPKGLGKFHQRNGVRSDVDRPDTQSPDSCVWSDCDGSCKPGMIGITDVRCDPVGSSHPRKTLCCPLGAAYDPNYCQWHSGKTGLWCGFPFINSDLPVIGQAFNKCQPGESFVIGDKWFKDSQGRDDVCHHHTKADYCCKNEREDTCKWSGVCIVPGVTVDNPCPGNMVPFEGGTENSLRMGSCDPYEGQWEIMCCEPDIEPECEWRGTPDNNCEVTCKEDEVDWGRHVYGGTKDCDDPRYPSTNFYQYGNPGNHGRVLCCKRESVRSKVKKLPVPVEYLFDPEDIHDGDEQEFDIDVFLDKDNESNHPNENSFGWHIMSGPKDQLNTLNKRDGSDWEVFGCDTNHHEGVQSARLVCTRDTDHNCDDIRLGGVADTILEMPPSCGPGKYAMAISLEPMHDGSQDDKMPHLVKRSLPAGSTVYNLTFDYGFHRLQGRADNEVVIRIDYSNVEGYWNEVVGKPTKRSLASIRDDVKRNHGNNYKRYLDHLWREDRRSTPPEELHLLQERWRTADWVDWVARISSVNKEAKVLDQKIKKDFIYTILDESRTCQVGGFPTTLSANLHARIGVDIQTSGVLTLIGHMNSLDSFKHSYINFRNKGEIKASLVFNAYGELRIPYKEETLLGIAPMGASFKIPGIVTIGPEFKLSASVEGQVSVEVKARVDFSVAEWDYSQRYPALADEFDDPTNIDPNKPKFSTSDNNGSGPMTFSWEVNADGIIQLHLIPMVTFGVVFDPSLELPSAAFDLGVDTYMRVHGQASVGSGQAFTYCIGAEAGYDTFARVTAPSLFGYDLNRRWSLLSDEVGSSCKLYTSLTNNTNFLGFNL